MALLYKKKYNHLNIEQKNEIDGYKIGSIYGCLIQDYKKNKISDEKVELLKSIGIDITISKLEKIFKEKMSLAEEALNNGIIISATNKSYKGVNLYDWIQK